MTTTNQGDEMEASKVTVGSRWRDKNRDAAQFGTAANVTVTAITAVTSAVVSYQYDGRKLDGADMEVGSFLKIMRPLDAAPAPVDWSKWLPPHPLPDTGKKEFKVGQVWAMHTTGGFTSVRRIAGAPERGCHDHDCESLAGAQGARLGQDSRAAEHSILVQDVNEPHPRDPATLWGGRCNHGDCRQPLAQGNVELCADHVASVMGRPAQQEGKSAPVTPQCQPSCRPGLRCNYCTTEVAVATPPAPAKPKCAGCDQERDLGATGKCWDCYEVGEAYVALVQQDADAKRAEIKRALMQPATLDPLWQRNPNVGVWRLR